MKEEEKTEVILAGWLLQNGYDVKTNRRHILNIGNFKTKGRIKAKPDLLIQTPKSKQYYAIEVKAAQTTKQVLGGTKILDYYHNYKEGNTTYWLEDNLIRLSGFLIATKYSPEGRLFFEEQLLSNETNPKYEYYSLQIPRYEYEKTHLFLRNLWDTWGRIRPAADAITPSVGILISDSVHKKTNLSKDVTSPLIMEIGSVFNNKKQKWQWLQRMVML